MGLETGTTRSHNLSITNKPTSQLVSACSSSFIHRGSSLLPNEILSRPGIAMEKRSVVSDSRPPLQACQLLNSPVCKNRSPASPTQRSRLC